MKTLPIIRRVPARQGNETRRAFATDRHFTRHLIADMALSIGHYPIPRRIGNAAQRRLAFYNSSCCEEFAGRIEGFRASMLPRGPARRQVVALLGWLTLQHAMLIFVKSQLNRCVFLSTNDLFTGNKLQPPVALPVLAI